MNMNFSRVTGPFIHPVSTETDHGAHAVFSDTGNECRAGRPEINFLEMTERFLARPESSAGTLKEIDEALKKEEHTHNTDFKTENNLSCIESHGLNESENSSNFHNAEQMCFMKVKFTETLEKDTSLLKQKLGEVSCSNNLYVSNASTQAKQGSDDPINSSEVDEEECQIEQAAEQTIKEISVKYEKGCQTYAFTDKSIAASKMIYVGEDGCEEGNKIADRELPYKCKFCGLAFSLFSHLKHHVKNHEKDAEFSCETCGRVYVSDNDLQRHKKKHCKPKTHKCTQCGNTYRLMHQLQSHLRTHTGEKPFLCETCGQGFSQKESLRLHERTHTGYKPHKCAICGKTFNSTKCLHRHELTHSGERNYKCDICGKSYQRNDHLRRHKRVHGEEPRFKCSYCGKAFHQKVNLEEHERIHTGTRPFVCDVCGKSFTQRGNLKSHLMKHSFV